jgi:DNA recombination protein RmuC
MFIPNEAAYICAMQLDHNLWQDAYDCRVLIISPTHLISVLKLIGQLWQQDRQTRNAIEIATESGRMYDKFVGFIDDMKKIEKSIQMSHDAYNNAMNKLTNGSGNLVTKAQKLRAMGAKASKSLPENITTNI